MRLLSVEVENILRVSDAKMKTEGHHLFLVGGKNSQGKSSALTAMLLALCGKREIDWPDLPLKEGEDRGKVVLELSGDPELHEDRGFTVELLLRRKRGGSVVEEFRILDSTGEEAPEPRALLKRLYSLRGFDPLSFERAKPADKAKLLRELLGLDFEALDKQYKAAYDERTIVNRQGVSKKAELSAIEFPSDTPSEPVLATELFAALQNAQKANQAIQRNAQMALSALESIKAEEAKLAAEEDKLRARLVEIDARRKEIDGAMDSVEMTVQDATSKTLFDEAAIEEQVKTCDAINRNVQAKRRHQELSKEVDDLRGASQKLTDKLKAIEEDKQERLSSAKWPLPGMSIDESGVLMAGLPFEQASKAERILASVRVGMALNPKLRLLICQDGNDLDNDTMAALDKALEENDFQMILEMVTRNELDEARCAVVFHDGKATSNLAV